MTRGPIAVAALIAGGDADQLQGHLVRARGNGPSETERVEVIARLAFSTGWPRAMSAIRVAKDDFKQ